MATSDIDLLARCQGGLLGCAVGDALGAPFEGLWADDIPDAEALLAGYAELEGYPRGQYTDDTQLTVATLESIVAEGEIVPAAIAQAFGRLWRQGAVVGPGGACMQAGHAFLETGDWRTCGAPPGQAGNGTAMRMPLLGLLFLDRPDDLPDRLADVARLTHHDRRSVAGGIAVAKAAQLLATVSEIEPAEFCAQVAEAIKGFDDLFAAYVRELPPLLHQEPIEALGVIAWTGLAQPQYSRPIITPFVVPTVLASLWCLLRNVDSWPLAVTDAIRCGGDVDTLGAIVGALAGVRLGASAIPEHLRSGVLHAEKLAALAARYHAVVVAR